MLRPPDNDSSESLEQLKRDLYSHRRRPDRVRVVRRRKESSDADDADGGRPLGWSYSPSPIAPPPQKPPREKRGNLLSRLLLVSLGVLVLTALFVGYRLFFAPPAISPQNVAIAIDAPTTTRAGDLVRVALRITNNNRVNLLDARLTVSFPENTLAADGSGVEVREVERSLGTIAPGASIEEEVSVFLFGHKNDELEIGISLDYGSEGTRARLSNERSHHVRMSMSPVLVTATPSVREVKSGDEFELEVVITSNTALRLDNILLEVVHPGGFNVVSSEPEPATDGTVWRLGDLAPETSKSVIVRGYLEGQSNESKFFTVRVGREGEGAIGRLFASVQERMMIVDPPIALSTTINRSAGQTVSSFVGAEVEVVINWANTLRAPLTNLIIEARIDDEFIQSGSIRVRGGFYRSADDTIIWNRSTNPRLGEISALDRDSVSFSFRIAGMREIGSVVNPDIPISIRVTASAPQHTGGVRAIENRIERVVRIASNLAVSQSLSHAGGPRTPVADSETLYTVSWTASSFGSRVNDVSVRAALPVYVTFENSDDPNIRFNPITNEVVWTIGNIGEGNEPARDLRTSFGISFIPSRDHIGTEPVVVEDALIEGRDAFTGLVLRSSAESLNSSRVSR